jgi:hypothetical protein
MRYWMRCRLPRLIAAVVTSLTFGHWFRLSPLFLLPWWHLVFLVPNFVNGECFELLKKQFLVVF